MSDGKKLFCFFCA